jgi:hypothetical protein
MQDARCRIEYGFGSRLSGSRDLVPGTYAQFPHLSLTKHYCLVKI